MTSYCGCRRHDWADQMGSAASSLAPLEITLRRARPPLAWLQDVGVHTQAHAASGFTPFDPSICDDSINSQGCRLVLDQLRARHNHGTNARSDFPPSYYLSRGL